MISTLCVHVDEPVQFAMTQISSLSWAEMSTSFLHVPSELDPGTTHAEPVQVWADPSRAQSASATVHSPSVEVHQFSDSRTENLMLDDPENEPTVSVVYSNLST
jgi:hypothetical protein